MSSQTIARAETHNAQQLLDFLLELQALNLDLSIINIEARQMSNGMGHMAALREERLTDHSIVHDLHIF